MATICHLEWRPTPYKSPSPFVVKTKSHCKISFYHVGNIELKVLANSLVKLKLLITRRQYIYIYIYHFYLCSRNYFGDVALSRISRGQPLFPHRLACWSTTALFLSAPPGAYLRAGVGDTRRHPTAFSTIRSKPWCHQAQNRWSHGVTSEAGRFANQHKAVKA